jgi:hypothetical protein
MIYSEFGDFVCFENDDEVIGLLKMILVCMSLLILMEVFLKFLIKRMKMMNTMKMMMNIL